MNALWKWLGFDEQKEPVQQSEPEPEPKKVSPYARQNRGPLNKRPQELAAALIDLRKRLPCQPEWPCCLVEVAQETKNELEEALKPLGIPLKFFQREEYVAIAILQVRDLTVLENLLQQEWLLNYPWPTVAFGKAW
jgi:hypothetical protein